MDQNNIPDDEIDLRELILTLVKGWKIIIASTLVVTALAAIYAYRLPNQYVVTTKAATVGGGSSSSQMAGLAAMAGIQMGHGDNEIDLLEHIDVIIKNSHFMDALLNRKWVISKEQKNDGGFPDLSVYDTITLAEYWGVPEPDTTIPGSRYPYIMELYGRLRNPKMGHIVVENSKGVLEVKTKFDNPDLSFQIHKELLTLLKEYFKNDYTSRDREKRIFVEERLKEVDKDLKKAETLLIRFREKNFQAVAPRIIFEGERLNREVELQASLYKELIKQLEIAKIDEKKETPVFEILQEAELPLVPSGPNRKIIAIIGFLGGVGAGVLFVLIKSWWQALRESK